MKKEVKELIDVTSNLIQGVHTILGQANANNFPSEMKKAIYVQVTEVQKVIDENIQDLKNKARGDEEVTQAYKKIVKEYENIKKQLNPDDDSIQAKLDEIEKRLAALEEKMEKMAKRSSKKKKQ